jgi:ribonuclease HII
MRRQAGRGAVIGPLVIAGVSVDKSSEKKLKKIGVKDSKKLTPKRREKLAKEIEKLAKEILILKIQPCKIDTLRAKGINLDKIEAMRMADIIEMINADKIYIDSLGQKPNKFKNLIKSFLRNKLNTELIVENYLDETIPVVSAASIIAKVERDKSIEEIKKKVNFDFASITYDEKILIEDERGIKRLVKIGELVENQLKRREKKKIYTFGINPKSLKIEKFEITNYIKHPSKKIVNLVLDHGKRIKLSVDHPLFVLSSNGDLVKKHVKDLKKGEYVAASKFIPCSNSIRKINLAKILAKFSTKNQPIFLSGKIIEKIVKNRNKLRKLARKNGYTRTSFYNWVNRRFLPLHLIEDRYLENRYLNDAQIKTTKTTLPAILEFDEDFMWLLGMYVAEGYIHSSYHIGIATTNERFKKRLEKIGKKFNITTTIYPDAVIFNSTLLVKLIRALKLGDNAYNKRIPEFLFSVSTELLKKFLEGYYAGDGYLREGGLFECETRSKKLAEELQWLNLLMKKFTSFKYDRKESRYIIRQLSLDTNSLSPDNIPSLVGKIIRDLRTKNNITLSKLSKASGIRAETISRIELQKNNTIRKQTLLKIIKGFKKLGCKSKKLIKILNSDLCWIKVKSIKNLNKIEPTYDLEIKPRGRKIENFICNGIIVHNSGYPHDENTIEFLKKLIKENRGKRLPSYVRKSWITTQSLQKASWQKKLKEFFFKKNKKNCKED